jgi:hypothetical protein
MESISALLKAGGKVDSFDVTGRSATYEASRNGHSDILTVLIAACKKVRYIDFR